MIKNSYINKLLYLKNCKTTELSFSKIQKAQTSNLFNKLVINTQNSFKKINYTKTNFWKLEYTLVMYKKLNQITSNYYFINIPFFITDCIRELYKHTNFKKQFLLIYLNHKMFYTLHKTSQNIYRTHNYFKSIKLFYNFLMNLLHQSRLKKQFNPVKIKQIFKQLIIQLQNKIIIKQKSKKFPLRQRLKVTKTNIYFHLKKNFSRNQIQKIIINSFFKQVLTYSIKQYLIICIKKIKKNLKTKMSSYSLNFIKLFINTIIQKLIPATKKQQITQFFFTLTQLPIIKQFQTKILHTIKTAFNTNIKSNAHIKFLLQLHESTSSTRSNPLQQHINIHKTIYPYVNPTIFSKLQIFQLMKFKFWVFGRHSNIVQLKKTTFKKQKFNINIPYFFISIHPLKNNTPSKKETIDIFHLIFLNNNQILNPQYTNFLMTILFALWKITPLRFKETQHLYKRYQLFMKFAQYIQNASSTKKI